MKFRFLNPYTYITGIILLITLAISWFFWSGAFEIITMNLDAPDLKGVNPHTFRLGLFSSILTWERFVLSSVGYSLDFIPILVILPAIGFIDRMQMVKDFGLTKIKSIPRYLAKEVFLQGTVSALLTSLTFTIFYSIGGLFITKNTFTEIYFFKDLLPLGFYNQHPYLTFMIMIWTVYFLFAFTLNILACCLGLLIEKKYLVLLSTYLVVSIASLSANYLFHNESLSPYTMLLSFEKEATTLTNFLPLCYLLPICLVFFIMGIKKWQNEVK